MEGRPLWSPLVFGAGTMLGMALARPSSAMTLIPSDCLKRCTQSVPIIRRSPVLFPDCVLEVRLSLRCLDSLMPRVRNALTVVVQT